ncbi:DUF4333 domain-containing protein [Mycobacterium sp. LTG2003]
MDAKSRFRLLVITVAVAGAALTGCGGATGGGSQPTVAKSKLQSLAKAELEAAAGKKAKSVECEDGIAGVVGATQRCVLTAKDGTRIGLTATVEGVDGDGDKANVNVDFKVDDKPMG